MALPARLHQIKTKPKRPLMASALSRQDFKKLLAKAKMEDALESELQISEQAWQNWALEDLAVDLKVMHLEDLVEQALDTNDAQVAEAELTLLPVRIALSGKFEPVPWEVKRFIRSLERLVEQVEREMAKATRKEDES